MARARPRLAAPALLAGVLLVHAWLLSAWPGSPARRTGGAPVLQVRQIEPFAPAPDPRTPVAPEPTGVPPFSKETPTVAPAPAPGVQQPTAPIAAARPAAPAATEWPLPPAPVPAAALSAAEGESAPIYATRPPAAATLHYALRRGTETGLAVLDWRPDGGRYALDLRGHSGGREIVGWSSRGTFDETGLAPERYVVRRRGRDILAANLVRGEDAGTRGGAGRITFSGPAREWPLEPGAQDRLSWVLQLAAVLEADPALARTGQTIVMWVVGARGEYEPWSFEVRTAVGPAEAAAPPPVHLVREPRRPYDTRVEVWLDPQRQHLPQRLRLASPPAGDALELQLQAAAAP